MADTSSLPPPTGPRFDGPPERGLARREDLEDVFVPRPGAKPAPVDKSRVQEYMAGVDPSNTGAVVLNIPGASLPVTLDGVGSFSPRLMVGGQRAKFRFPGKFVIPMEDGIDDFAKVRSWPPGYVKVLFNGVPVFEEERPRGLDLFLMWALFAAPFFTFRSYIAAPLGIFSMWGAGWWLKQPEPSRRVKRLVLACVVVAEIALAVVVFIAVFNLLSD